MRGFCFSENRSPAAGGANAAAAALSCQFFAQCTTDKILERKISERGPRLCFLKEVVWNIECRLDRATKPYLRERVKSVPEANETQSNSLGRSGEMIREGIGFETLSCFALRRERTALVKNSGADHADVIRVVIFLVRVGFVHRAEAKSRHLVGALAKAVDDEAAMRLDDVSAFAHRGRAPVEHVEPSTERTTSSR